MRVITQIQAREALRVLGAIATIEANGNSDPDIMAGALDGAISEAQAFFRLNDIALTDCVGPVRPDAADNPERLPTLAIIIEGGLVQCVVSDNPSAFALEDILVIDYDDESADDDECSLVPQEDGSMSRALVHSEALHLARIDLAGIVEDD